MNFIIRFFICFCVSLALTSCMSTILNTHVQHVANLHEKEDISLQAGVAAPTGTVSASAAYAVGKVLALSAAAQSNLQGDYYAQAGFGVYRRIKKHNFFEDFITIGYGIGTGAPNQGVYIKQYIDTIMNTKPSLSYHNTDNHGRYIVVANQVSFSAANRHFPKIMYGISLKTGFLYSYIFEKVQSNHLHNLFYSVDESGYSSWASSYISPLTYIKYGGNKYVFTYFLQMQIIDNTLAPFTFQYTGMSNPLLNTGCMIQFNSKKQYKYGMEPKVVHVPRADIVQDKRLSLMIAAGYNERKKELLYHTFPDYDSLAFTNPTSKSTPVLALGAEYQINPWVSVGAQASYQRSWGAYEDFIMLRPNGTVTYPYTIFYTHNQVSVGVKPLFHIVHRAQFELYCGGMAGILHNSVHSIATPDGLSATRVHPYTTGYAPVWQVIPLGVRYYPLPEYGCSVEFGYPHVSLVQVGLQYRM